MMEAQIRMYHAIGGIDDSFVVEALRPVRVEKRPVRLRLLAAAASFLLVLTGAAALLASRSAPVQTPPLEDPQLVGTEPVVTLVPRDYGPISFGALALPETLNLAKPYGDASASRADIGPFLEDSLRSQCCGILEGTVLRVYPKRYAYAYYDDKFGPMELFHGLIDTVVYALAVETVWYGADFTPGSTVLVEDDVFGSSNFTPTEGQRCVIPIYEYGDTEIAHTNKPLAEGDLSRDSRYSNLYPFHPQITKTGDGDYLITTDWTTLAAEPCRVVELDETYPCEALYRDRFRLVYGDDFARRMEALIETQLGQTQ